MNKLFILLLLLLTSCAVHKTSFECKAGKGLNCRSASDIHQMILNNTIENEKHKASKQYTPTCLSCNKHNIQPNKPILSSLQANSSNYPVKRSPEKVMRIWINSYFDENNNFLSDQYIYTVIEPAKWIVE